jgi:hypothetical protein
MLRPCLTQPVHFEQTPELHSVGSTRYVRSAGGEDRRHAEHESLSEGGDGAGDEAKSAFTAFSSQSTSLIRPEFLVTFEAAARYLPLHSSCFFSCLASTGDSLR